MEKKPKTGKKTHNDPYAVVRSAASRWRGCKPESRAVLCIMVDESQEEHQVATVIGNTRDQLFGGLMAVLEQNHEIGAEIIYAVAAFDLTHGNKAIDRIKAQIAEARAASDAKDAARQEASNQEPQTHEADEDNQN